MKRKPFVTIPLNVCRNYKFFPNQKYSLLRFHIYKSIFLGKSVGFIGHSLRLPNSEEDFGIKRNKTKFYVLTNAYMLFYDNTLKLFLFVGLVM